MPSRLCWVAVACLLAGCQTAMLTGSPSRATIAQFVGYGLRVRMLGPAELEQTYARLSAKNQSQPSDVTSIELSLLLSNPAASFYDPQRAIRLLDGASRRLEAKSDPLAPFPRLLDSVLHERQDVVRQNDALSAALASVRSRNQVLTRQLAQTQSDLGTERARSKTLQSQLDALRALEQQINHDDISQ